MTPHAVLAAAACACRPRRRHRARPRGQRGVLCHRRPERPGVRPGVPALPAGRLEPVSRRHRYVGAAQQRLPHTRMQPTCPASGPCRWEVVEAAAGAPYLLGASIPANMTGPQVGAAPGGTGFRREHPPLASPTSHPPKYPARLLCADGARHAAEGQGAGLQRAAHLGPHRGSAIHHAGAAERCCCGSLRQAEQPTICASAA